MMQATPNSHDSQYRMQNGLIKKDEVYPRIRNDPGKGRYTSPELCDYDVGVLTVIGRRHA